jgi:predicted nucleic acid-binding protein
MPAVLLFDTNIWSDLLLGDEAEQQRVRQRLVALRATYGDFVRATSRICVVEALVAARIAPTAHQRDADEALLQSELEHPALIVVELTDKIFGETVAVGDRAASLRAEMVRRTRALAPASGITADGGKLKLPDAIIAASCLHFSPPAVLFTKNRKDFEVTDGRGGRVALTGLVVEPL